MSVLLHVVKLILKCVWFVVVDVERVCSECKMWNVFVMNVLSHVVKLILKGLFVVVDVKRVCSECVVICCEVDLEGVVCGRRCGTCL